MDDAAVLKKTHGLEIEIECVSDDRVSRTFDSVAIEEPLEIRLGFEKNGKFSHKAISITMRTPGNDFELAAGFLFTEGIISSRDQIASIKHCGIFPNNRNTVRIDLTAETRVDLKKLERHFYTSSSCGVCGKSSIEAIANGAENIENDFEPKLSGEFLHNFPEIILKNQAVFDETGGLHAAALFDLSGNLVDLREDVGRHNAVDKLIGKQFLDSRLPLKENVLFLSGRASFELVQKAVIARIPIIAAVGAPSSLAVEAAKAFRATLIGFVRDRRFNVYTGAERLEF